MPTSVATCWLSTSSWTGSCSASRRAGTTSSRGCRTGAPFGSIRWERTGARERGGSGLVPATFRLLARRIVAGRLLHRQRLLRRELDGSLATCASLPSVSTKSWDDIVVDGHGTAYVNNIGFEFPSGNYAPGEVVLVSADGVVKSVADGLTFPDGMAVTAGRGTPVDRLVEARSSQDEELGA